MKAKSKSEIQIRAFGANIEQTFIA